MCFTHMPLYPNGPIANALIHPEPTEPPTLDCRVVLCAKPTCDDPLPAPPGECCPVCPGIGTTAASYRSTKYEFYHLYFLATYKPKVPLSFALLSSSNSTAIVVVPNIIWYDCHTKPTRYSGFISKVKLFVKLPVLVPKHYFSQWSWWIT